MLIKEIFENLYDKRTLTFSKRGNNISTFVNGEPPVLNFRKNLKYELEQPTDIVNLPFISDVEDDFYDED